MLVTKNTKEPQTNKVYSSNQDTFSFQYLSRAITNHPQLDSSPAELDDVQPR